MNATQFLLNHDIGVTKIREQIVDALLQSNSPLSYDEILTNLEANKTTIYRTLDLLQSKNLIIKSEDRGKSYYALSSGAKAFFVCETCHKIEEISMPDISKKHIKSVIVKGICEDCD